MTLVLAEVKSSLRCSYRLSDAESTRTRRVLRVEAGGGAGAVSSSAGSIYTEAGICSMCVAG